MVGVCYRQSNCLKLFVEMLVLTSLALIELCALHAMVHCPLLDLAMFWCKKVVRGRVEQLFGCVLAFSERERTHILCRIRNRYAFVRKNVLWNLRQL
jgi:hypothetical protein